MNLGGGGNVLQSGLSKTTFGGLRNWGWSGRCLFLLREMTESRQKIGGSQKGGFGGCSPGTKTGTRVRSPKPPFWKPPFYLPVTLFGVDKRVVSKRVVSADVPPERKPERGYIRQNHPFTKPPFYLPVKKGGGKRIVGGASENVFVGDAPEQFKSRYV